MASEKSTNQAGSSTLGLQNRLLEVAVIVGMDEETGLIPRKLNKFNNVSENISLFECHFQGHLLDIMSGPQDEPQSPIKELGIPSNWRQSLKQMSLKKASREAKQKKTVQRSRSIRKMRNKANRREEVPVSTDFLRNLPCICLPDDSRVVSNPSNPTFHTTVLTDIGGNHHYAAVLTFFRPYYALPDEEAASSCWKLSEKAESASSNSTSQPTQCHVPCCLCFVSKKPYFEVLKDCLSCFYKELCLSSRTSFRKLLEKYVTNLSLMLCPPPRFNLRYTVSSLPIVLMPPDDPLKPNRIIDIDLRLPLFIFMKDPAVLLSVLACIMLEQRIVFLSESYPVLTLVVECLLHYIRPMEWHHQYIPILFSEIIGFVDCPGIFIMGCHSKHKMEIEKVENDLFLVDLDNCRVYTNSSSSFKTGNGLSGQFASQMPDFAVQSFLRSLSELRVHNSVLNLSSISPVSLEELRNSNLERRMLLNKKIQSIFMDLMIHLFSSALQFIDHERHQFKYNEFLESIQPTDSPFYIKAVKTYMFRRFINQRMKQAPDEFSRIVEMRLRRRSALLIQQKRNQSRIRSLDVINENKPIPSIYKTVRGVGSNSQIDQMFDGNESDSLFSSLNVEENYFTSSQSFGEKPAVLRRSSELIPESIDLRKSSAKTNAWSVVSISLPSFPVQGTSFNTKHYYRRCIEVVNECWQKLSMDTRAARADASNSQTLPSSSLRAGLLTLRGYYKVAEGSLVHGLEDLNAIAKEDANLFPEKTIEKIILSLNQQELTNVKKLSFYKGPPANKTAGKRTFSSASQSPSQFDYLFDENGVPFSPLAEGPFHQMLEKTDVTADEKELSVLFQALAQSSDEIDPEIFSVFLQTWKQLKHECELAQNKLCVEIGMFQDGGTGKQMDEVSGDITNALAFHPREVVLKVSATVSSNRGNGRVVLTTRRVFFIAAGNNDWKSSIQLQEILFVKIGKLKNFVSSTQALIIIYQNDSSSPLKVGLKAECELWLHLINEMKTGRNLSREKRDQQQSSEAAAQNVRIADAFYAMIKDEDVEYMKLDDAMAWVVKLCKFKGMHDAGETRSLSPETEEMLVMCMDPSPKESKKSGIQSLIYAAAGIDEIPQVWVALGSGKLRLIDTTSWSLDPRPVKDWKSQPLCMCMVCKSELWIGSDDGMIYVLLMETMKTARILNDHSTPVIAISKTESGTVVSAAKNGEIIVWSIEPINVSHKFTVFSPQDELVSFFPFRSKFCCCSYTFLVVCDSSGKTTQQFSLGEFASLSIASNLTCCSWDGGNEIWAGDSRGAVYAWDCSSFNFQFAKNSSFGSPLHLTGSKSKVERDLMPKFSGILHELHSNVAITCMVKNAGQIWLGNSNGEIIVLNTSTACQERALKAHNGPVTTLCKLESRYMISGSDDGKIMVWRQ